MSGPTVGRTSATLLAFLMAVMPAVCLAAEKGLSANMLQAEAAIEREDYAQAARHLDAACRQGGALGCYDLAVLEHEGLAGPRNLARAAALNRRACDLGNVDGCANLGTQLLTGDGVPADRRRAKPLLERSCRNESPSGCFGLALLQEGLFGGRADTLKGLLALEHACRIGHSEACYRRGHQLAQSAKVPDWHAAAAWYNAACEGGLAAGCNALGALAGEGKGGPVDPERALRLFRQACESGSATGCRNLGNLIGQGKLGPVDGAAANAAIARAAAIESGQIAGQRQPMP